MPITNAQQKYLHERLGNIRNTKPSRYEKLELPESASVKAARKQVEAATKVVTAHEEKVSKAKIERNNAIAKEVDSIKQIILFGDAKAAIAALDKFEAQEF